MAKVLIGNFKGPKGDKGDKGDPGTAATIQVGTTQTVQPEENAEVTNSGTANAVVLNFKIPRGEDGMTDLTAEYKDASEYACQPTVNAPVVLKEIDGKTEQGENPSPDNPQAIKGVGGMGYFDGEWRQGSYDIYGVPNTSGAWISFANKIPCKANDNIKVSYDKDIVGIRIFFWNTSGGFLSSEHIDGKETTGWTAPATAGSFVISFNGNNISPALAAYCTVTINGEYQTGVEVNGANLFDASKIATKTQGGATVTNNGDGSFTVSGSGKLTEQFIASFENYDIINKLKEGKITLDCLEVTYPFFEVDFVDIENKNVIILSNLDKTKLTEIITAENLSKISKSVFYIYGSPSSEKSIISGIFKPMLYQDGDGTYQPYHHTAISIPLTSPLYEGDKICYVKPGESYVNAEGDTVVADGILYGCYRENAVATFDGSEDENWSSNGENNRYRIALNNSNNIYTENTAKCNFFKYNANVYPDANDEIGFIVSKNSFLCRFSSASEINSVSNLRAWLQSNPLTVVYKLAQPYFEPFTDQSIFYGLRTDDTLSYVYSSDPIEPNVTVDVAKNSTGGYLLESYAQAQKNALSEADNASRLASVEQQLLTLNTTVSTMGGGSE